MIKRIVIGSAIAAAGLAGYMSVRRWWETWGVDPEEGSRSLPGDELVPDATMVDTRGITIDAPVGQVWPWLVQMGYGRGGWYSWDAIDMKGSSAEAIRPELQQVAVGDVFPTDPGGGFVVKVVEPERALVLYVDPEILAARKPSGPVVGDELGLAASGKFLETATPPRFTLAWAFVLEPVEGERTRLIERFRARIESESQGSKALAPLLGFGLFLMTQRQMRNIQARAEKLAREREAFHRDVDAVVERALTGDPAEAPAG